MAYIVKKSEPDARPQSLALQYDNLDSVVLLKIVFEKVLHNGLHPYFRRQYAHQFFFHVTVIEKLVII